MLQKVLTFYKTLRKFPEKKVVFYFFNCGFSLKLALVALHVNVNLKRECDSNESFDSFHEGSTHLRHIALTSKFRWLLLRLVMVFTSLITLIPLSYKLPFSYSLVSNCKGVQIANFGKSVQVHLIVTKEWPKNNPHYFKISWSRYDKYG